MECHRVKGAISVSGLEMISGAAGGIFGAAVGIFGAAAFSGTGLISGAVGIFHVFPTSLQEDLHQVAT